MVEWFKRFSEKREGANHAMNESKTRAERIAQKVRKKQRMIRAAMGQEKADLVLKNATYVNVFSNELCQGVQRRGGGGRIRQDCRAGIH